MTRLLGAVPDGTGAPGPRREEESSGLVVSAGGNGL